MNSLNFDSVHFALRAKEIQNRIFISKMNEAKELVSRGAAPQKPYSTAYRTSCEAHKTFEKLLKNEFPPEVCGENLFELTVKSRERFFLVSLRENLESCFTGTALPVVSERSGDALPPP